MIAPMMFVFSLCPRSPVPQLFSSNKGPHTFYSLFCIRPVFSQLFPKITSNFSSFAPRKGSCRAHRSPPTERMSLRPRASRSSDERFWGSCSSSSASSPAPPALRVLARVPFFNTNGFFQLASPPFPFNPHPSLPFFCCNGLLGVPLSSLPADAHDLGPSV